MDENKYITVLFTDTHFGTHNNSMGWFKSQKEFITEQFIPHLKQRKSEGYKIRLIHCGDVFDSRSTINSYIATGVVKMFDEILKIVDRFIIVAGNHDFFQPDSDSVDTVNLIFKQLALIHDPKLVIVSDRLYMDEWNGEVSAFVPWYEWMKEDNVKHYIDENNIDSVFTHADLIMGKTDIKIPIITGHVHTPMFNKNINNIGSCYALTFTDANQTRGFYEYEKLNNLQFFDNKYSIRFWRLYNDDILKIPAEIKRNDYIELYAPKTLLAKKKYTDACNKWFDKFKNVVTIPQPEELQGTDIKQFEQYNIEDMIESHIPEELKDKFNQVKQYINNNKEV